jgi:hypothetical protein
VAPAGNGRTGEQLEIARAPEADVTAGTIRVRHGFGDDLDVAFEGSAIHVPFSRGAAIRAWGARTGVKQRVARGVALSGGLGGGGFRGGPFAAPDAGAIAAYENPWLVPFAAGRGAISVPLQPRGVDLDGEVARPKATWYGALVIGARMPIGWSPPEPHDLRGSLLAGWGYTWVVDAERSARMTSWALGAELTF